MKVAVILLLLCCVSVSSSSLCTKEVDAALSEVTATLAQHKADIRLLRKQHQEEVKKQKTEVDKLKQKLRVRQVAFSASLVNEVAETIGPFYTHTPLIFRHVQTNIGNAYNNNTGNFTAPVRGAYHFEWYFGVHGDGQHSSCTVLVQNSEHVFAACERQESHYGMSANGATLLLEAGDVVFLRLWAQTKVFDNHNHVTTFSGRLLFTM